MFRVRVARQPDPLWETVLSLTLLGSSDARAVLGPWRAQAREALRGLPRPQLRLLRQLVPPVGDFPDFLTPAEASQGVEAGMDVVLSTPRSRLRRELAPLPGASSWASPLAAGDDEALVLLGDALSAYHETVIAPYASQMQALVDAERAVCARSVLDHSGEGLLDRLGPTMRWKPPVLEVDYPVRHEIRLNGRGLLLLPSAFCWRVPVTLVDPSLPPVLVYPVSRNLEWWAGPGGHGSEILANLLGRTRAACLKVIESGCTTGEMARRVGATASSASQHATTLREAGLITSTRQANEMIHTLTPLGTELLRLNPTSALAR
ncbi:ArsR/SmtB family transcription factor [Sphaerisporangium corydalis]|uniref:ArsR/SmtB family transcription factor n=1 Tax=Sphaerisporangium corydalis TaxID=1441875 RepID=A0ABV9EK04_9ACTN|nr:winged helix-turn-helix domain-containing protein [Sphaerisporangium corydalis]